MKQLFLYVSKKTRAKRAQVFRAQFELDPATKILDLGSGNGDNIHFVLQGTGSLPQNVFIADIDSHAVSSGKDKFGYNPVVLDESAKLPFPDSFFDVVYCSSVIEHVTVPKAEVWTISSQDFKRKAWKHQKEFAAEIMRIGRRYFVQTPNKNFIIESHTWLPFLGYLRRNALLRTLKISNAIWILKSNPDFHLLGIDAMKELFPDAKIILEKTLGIMVKSIMAIKK